jgi:hypothetical protein
MAQLSQTSEPAAIADAIADVAHSAQRIVEERIELFRLEVRKDMRHILQASALGVSGAVALAVAVGMAAGAVTWTLALWMPFGPALGITAVLTGVAGVVLSVMARSRLPGGEKAKEQDDKAALEEPAARRALRTGHHDVEAPT